jgi:hypothetical protein
MSIIDVVDHLQHNYQNPSKDNRNSIRTTKENLTIKNKAPSATAFIRTSKSIGTKRKDFV